MQYLLLIYQPEAKVNTWSEQDKGTFLDELTARGELAEYHLPPAARADLLRRLGQWSEAHKPLPTNVIPRHQ